MTLLELYKNNRKNYLDTDKEDPNHRYISKFYSDEFAKYKDKKINLLEIGLGSGGSLILWSDYFKEANITGIDSGTDTRFLNCMTNTKSYDNIRLIACDAYNQDLINTLPEFDIMIDDGPHTLQSHLWFLEYYLPKLKSNGVAIIEDIDDIKWIEFYKKFITEEYTCETIDTDRNIEYNNLLFVIRKK